MIKNVKSSGVIVPMVSPFKEDFSIDEKAVEKIVSKFVEAGVTPFIIGTTGESESMSISQKDSLVKATVNVIGKTGSLFAGISDNSINDSIEQAVKYASYGVDAVVSTVPYYYPANSLQMEKYFIQLADAIPCPLIIYNMPSTTGISLPLELVDQLSYHKNIIGIKDSERNVVRLDQSLKLWKDRDDFAFLIGWAAMSVYGLRNGADGIVPGTGNFCPDLYKDLYDFVEEGNIEVAEDLQGKTNYISSLYQKGWDLSHSIPALKVLMSEVGLCGTQVLPPMYRMEEGEEKAYRQFLKDELKEYELLK